MMWLDSSSPRMSTRRPTASPLLALFLMMIFATIDGGFTPMRRGAGSRLAFFGGGKRRLPSNFKISNGTNVLTSGQSVFLVANCTVNHPSMYSLDPSIFTRGPGGPMGAGGRNQSLSPYSNKSPVDLVVGEMMQTIGGTLLDAFCLYLASRIVMTVRGCWNRAFVRSPSVRFADVIGCNYAKEEVMQLVDFLQDPAKYRRLGAQIPKGVLLVGPPGVGKTMIAKALAGEASVPFYYVSGADFAQPFWGMGIQKIKRLFRQARKSKRAIVFIDEFDALARVRRSTSAGGSAEMDAENTLNQLLTEMDGFQTQDNVIVLASTNRPEVLDRAALRPGRFDRKVFIDPPDVQGREEHFRRLLSKFKLEKPVDYLAPLLSKLTPGYVGADIVNVCNEAALRAAKMNRTSIHEEDLSWATERTGFGVERKGKISQTELRRTAVHETGHALVSYMLPSCERPVKISIINRGQMAGYNLMNEGNTTYQTEAKLRDDIAVLLGGRAAEDVMLGDPSTGASDDLRKASAIARAAVERLGYSKKTGLLTLGQSEGREVSQTTLRILEEEAQMILATEYVRAKAIITKYKFRLNALVELLLEKEVVHEHEIAEAFGVSPPGSSPTALALAA